MTTAHRPTWKPAVGKSNEGGWSAGGARSTQTSALDAPGQLTLKLRAKPIDRQAALKQSLLALEEAETSTSTTIAKRRPLDPQLEARSQQRLLLQTTEVDVEHVKNKYNDADADNDDDDDGGGGGSSSEESDLDDNDSNSDDNNNDDDSDDDDDDDEEALQAELAKIRAERQQAQQAAQQAEAQQEQAEQEEAALLGNPLLAGGAISTSGNNSNKRRWNEDVVFRHQAKGEPKPKKRFINDTIRNSFHRRFLNKFIR